VATYKNSFNAYQTTQVTTATPQKILIMLYEGAIKFIIIARQRMIEKKIAEKGKYIGKAIAIVSELMNTLDHDQGGQLAVDIENLYMFVNDKLIEGNIKNDIQCLDDAEKILKTLLTAWQDVIENPRPDGIPSPRLQQELYASYQTAVQKK
jgi:flagellar secretion chaperone FliS